MRARSRHLGENTLSSRSGTPRSLVTKLVEVKSTGWGRWNWRHYSEFHKTVPYTMLYLKAGLRELVTKQARAKWGELNRAAAACLAGTQRGSRARTLCRAGQGRSNGAGEGDAEEKSFRRAVYLSPAGVKLGSIVAISPDGRFLLSESCYFAKQESSASSWVCRRRSSLASISAVWIFKTYCLCIDRPHPVLTYCASRHADNYVKLVTTDTADAVESALSHCAPVTC